MTRFFPILCCLMAVGCSSGPGSLPTTDQGNSSGGRDASVTFQVKWPTADEAGVRVIPPETQSIRVQVSVGGVTVRDIVIPRQAGLITSVALADLPVGTALFTATAHQTTDGTGPVLAQGQATVNLVAGQANVVNLVLALVPDTTPPSVEIVSPLSGATIGGTVSIITDASDDRGVVTVGFTAGGVFLGEDATSPYEASLDTTLFPNGSLVVSVTARDAAGNVASYSVTVTVNNITPPPPDTTPPTVQITAPANGATVSGVVTLEAVASDNVGVVGVRFIADAADLGEDASSPYQASWDTTSVTNGSYQISATARDAAGNTASYTITVVVDNPVLPELGPFEPFRGQFVSFTMTTGSGQGLSLVAESLNLDDFGQIVVDCLNVTASGWLAWYANIERRTEGVVDAELKIGGYLDPVALAGTIETGIHPGDFADRLRQFSTSTGEVTGSRWVTGGRIPTLELVTTVGSERLTFNNVEVGLEDGSVLTGTLRSTSWVIL